MINWIRKIFIKRKRVDLKLVGYHEADAFLNNGWQIARPEEDNNLQPFLVYVELLEDK